MAVAEEKGVAHHVVLYLKEKPDRAALERLVAILDDPVEDLVRKDSRFKSLNLDANDYVGNASAVVDLLTRHIALMQRPVLVKGNRAIIGRPKDRVGDFMG